MNAVPGYAMGEQPLAYYLTIENWMGRSGDFSRFAVGDERLKSSLPSIKIKEASGYVSPIEGRFTHDRV